jgi:hypothetical protein
MSVDTSDLIPQEVEVAKAIKALMLNEAVKYKRMMLAERELKDMYKEMADAKKLDIKELAENKAAAILSLVTMALTAVVKQASDRERKDTKRTINPWVLGLSVMLITATIVMLLLRFAGVF